MLNREKVETLRRFAALYASIEQEDTVLKYLSIIFIKFASETGFGMGGGEDFSAYTKVMKCFTGSEKIFPDQYVSLVVNRLSEKLRTDMHFLHFSFNSTVLSWLFRNIDVKNLPGWKLSELTGEDKKAELRDVADAVNVLSSMYYGSNRLGTAYNVLYNISSKILNVSKDDVFADLVAGQGISTFLITNGEAKEYHLADIVSYNALLILSALYSVNEMSISRRALESSEIQSEIADKMFMDPPVAGAVLSEKADIDGVVVRETTGASILRMVESLKKNGIGVITTSGKTLVGTTPALTEIKHRLINHHLLKAVITLPPCWVGTSIKTNLLVISKEENEGVVFIDASASKVVGMIGDELLNADGVLIVPEIIKALINKATTNISRFVSYSDINGVNLTPIAYLESNKTVDSTSLHDVDVRLAQVYVEMATIISEMQQNNQRKDL